MGCYAPVPLVTPELYARAVEQILKPAVAAIRDTGIPYKGVLYAGIMIVTPDGELKTLEFNCRFGDPKHRPCCPCWKRICWTYFTRRYRRPFRGRGGPIRWKAGKAPSVSCWHPAAIPAHMRPGLPIDGLEQVAHLSDVAVFQAGTAQTSNRHGRRCRG